MHRVLGLVVGALLVGACGGGGADAPPPELTAGPDEVLIRYEVGGGFVPPEHHLIALPTVVVYGDGTVLTQVQTGEHGVLAELELSEDDLEELVADLHALDLGQFPEDVQPQGPVNVADAPTTTFELRFGDEPVLVHAYALGIGGPEMRYPEELEVAMRLLEDLADRARTEGHEWQPDRALLSVSGTLVGEGQQVVAWPSLIDVPAGTADATFDAPATVVVDGADLAVVRTAFAGSAFAALQLPDGAIVQAVWRPLLPHEDAPPA